LRKFFKGLHFFVIWSFLKFWHLTSVTFCWLIDIKPGFSILGNVKDFLYIRSWFHWVDRRYGPKESKISKNTEMNTQKDLKGERGLLSSFITCSSIILIWFVMRKCNQRRGGRKFALDIYITIELILRYCDSTQRKYTYSNSWRKKFFRK